MQATYAGRVQYLQNVAKEIRNRKRVADSIYIKENAANFTVG